MNWVKCTDMNKQPIYVNIENATSIRWDEKEKSSIIAFAVTGGDTIEVIEEPDAIICAGRQRSNGGKAEMRWTSSNGRD